MLNVTPNELQADCLPGIDDADISARMPVQATRISGHWLQSKVGKRPNEAGFDKLTGDQVDVRRRNGVDGRGLRQAHGLFCPTVIEMKLPGIIER